MWIEEDEREHLSTSITVVNLSPVGSCVDIELCVMRDVQNCDSNNTTHILVNLRDVM